MNLLCGVVMKSKYKVNVPDCQVFHELQYNKPCNYSLQTEPAV